MGIYGVLLLYVMLALIPFPVMVLVLETIMSDSAPLTTNVTIRTMMRTFPVQETKFIKK